MQLVVMGGGGEYIFEFNFKLSYHPTYVTFSYQRQARFRDSEALPS